jgi:small membrane protein
MTPIQLILILLVFALALLYFSKLRTHRIDRIVLVGAFIGAVALILRPDLANDIAHLLGVGRGADLILYLGMMIIGLVLVSLYSQVRALHEQLTELTRTLAIERARLVEKGEGEE